MNTIVVIQARTGSSRLPGKVLLPLVGKPLLLRMVERVLGAKRPGAVVVATTTDSNDDAVVSLCVRARVPVFRGHPTDLLDRHFQAAVSLGAKASDLIVKVPSDCPLIDPRVIDRVLSAYEPGVDFVSNMHPASYPDGNDVEVMPFSVLSIAWREAVLAHEREHTTPFIWDQPGRFNPRNVAWETGLDYSMSHRFTIDYPEDYAFVAAVYEGLFRGNPLFSLTDILDYLARHPQIGALNAKYCGVNWYRHHLGQLRTVSAEQTREIPS
jgi:spore coat polysaccharide biosynthesis protein SpsF